MKECKPKSYAKCLYNSLILISKRVKELNEIESKNKVV